MNSALILGLCACLALPPGSATRSAGQQTTSSPLPETLPALQQAREAWSRGEFSRTRALLEPLAEELETIADPHDRHAVLVLLADAGMGDKTLDPNERRDYARAQLERLMDLDPDWRMPRDFYAPELYELYDTLRDERAARRSTQCEGELIACKSDVAGIQDQLEAERRARAQLQQRYDDQEVQVVETVARTRALAALPFGFGHFYNAGVGSRRRTGRPLTRDNRVDLGLGASFLIAEALAGAAGLGLLIHRIAVDGCRRTRGFSSGSLTCDPPNGEADRDGIRRRRKAEEGMAWTLLGLVGLEITLAQIRFRPTETREIRRTPRRKLQAEPGATPTPPAGRPRGSKPHATLRAAPLFNFDGATLAVDLRF